MFHSSNISTKMLISASLPVPTAIIKSLSLSWSSPSAWWRASRHQACSDERSPHPSSQCRPGTTSHSPRNTPWGLQSLPGEDSKGRAVIHWVWMWEHDNYISEKTFCIGLLSFYSILENMWLGLTWQASTPPAKNPLQSILEVTWPSVTMLHTVSLMIFTIAFCSSCAFEPARAGQKEPCDLSARH